MKVSFVAKLPVAKNIFTFQFRPVSPLSYTAGQFIRMNLEHDNPDERGVSRFFTLSSSPAESHLAITTKFANEKSSTFKTALQNLKTGDQVTMSTPDGDFTLPKKEVTEKLVFVAGGIGVTPYHSMIKYLADTNQQRPVHLIYAAPEPEQLAFKDLFDSLSWLKKTYLTGKDKLSASKIGQIINGFDNKIIYLSGPEPMIESLFEQLKSAGVDKKQLRTDYFPGYKDI